MKKKGFTLIELLAVIVILAVIALIATPMILGVIETARTGAAENAAVGYIEAVEKSIMLSQLTDNPITVTSEEYTVSNGKVGTFEVNFKGDAPTGTITFNSDGSVKSATLTFKNISDKAVTYTNEKESIKEKLSGKIKIGDYVKMTPTSTSYTIDASLTGYDTNQTINPSELNLWRIIDIKEDGTVDMVSEYVSSTGVYFKGATGYQHLAGTLNIISKQYENIKYTVGSRHMGYNGQVLVLPESDIFSIAGNDRLYQKDENLINTAIGIIQAYKVGTTTYANYWTPSRMYQTNVDLLTPFFVDSYGDISTPASLGTPTLPRSVSFSVRPIVIVGSDATILNGVEQDGTSEKPWILD